MFWNKVCIIIYLLVCTRDTLSSFTMIDDVTIHMNPDTTIQEPHKTQRSTIHMAIGIAIIILGVVVLAGGISFFMYYQDTDSEGYTFRSHNQPSSAWATCLVHHEQRRNTEHHRRHPDSVQIPCAHGAAHDTTPPGNHPVDYRGPNPQTKKDTFANTKKQPIEQPTMEVL